MITAINVQHEVGGNLSEILDTIGHTIRERVRIQGEIRVLTAQGMLSGYVISLLPIALMGILFVINREYVGSMFKEPCGWAMLAFMAVTMSVGFYSIQKIVHIDV
jgi:tight adherence protein B